MKKEPKGMTGGIPRKKRATGRIGAHTAWIRAIRLSGGEHGAGILQKKLWRLVSDLVRIRDWYKYGVCVATGRKINHWREGHAGHFRPYSICRGIFKFDERNIFLQSPMSNNWGGYDDWIAFEDEVVKRTSHDKASMDRLNLAFPLKINDTLVIEKMEDILGQMINLPEQPEYFERVISLR